jgi:hypothetical protein
MAHLRPSGIEQDSMLDGGDPEFLDASLPQPRDNRVPDELRALTVTRPAAAQLFMAQPTGGKKVTRTPDRARGVTPSHTAPESYVKKHPDNIARDSYLFLGFAKYSSLAFPPSPLLFGDFFPVY